MPALTITEIILVITLAGYLAWLMAVDWIDGRQRGDAPASCPDVSAFHGEQL